MRLFKPRFQFTDNPSKLVGFFFTQYIEVMKNGKDKTDDRMKDYLFEIITELGVPTEIDIEEEVIEEPPVEVIPASPSFPIIHRRK